MDLNGGAGSRTPAWRGAREGQQASDLGVPTPGAYNAPTPGMFAADTPKASGAWNADADADADADGEWGGGGDDGGKDSGGAADGAPTAGDINDDDEAPRYASPSP